MGEASTSIEEENENIKESEIMEAIVDEQQVDDLKVGMEFDIHEDLFDYYVTYGRKKGFEVVKLTNKKANDGMIKYVTFACAREGKSAQTLYNSVKPQPIKKISCGAKLNGKLCSNGKWQLSSMTDEHNHTLSPSNSRSFARNRIISTKVNRQLNLNARAGIRLNQSFNACVVEAGAPKNLPFLKKDARNENDKERRLRLKEGDAATVFKYFQKMQSSNSRFFYIMDVDEHGQRRYVLGRCKKKGRISRVW